MTYGFIICLIIRALIISDYMITLCLFSSFILITHRLETCSLYYSDKSGHRHTGTQVTLIRHKAEQLRLPAVAGVMNFTFWPGWIPLYRSRLFIWIQISLSRLKHVKITALLLFARSSITHQSLELLVCSCAAADKRLQCSEIRINHSSE